MISRSTAALWAVMVLLLSGARATPVDAQSAPLDAYGALPAVEFVSVSPSGARLASVKVEGERRGLLVTDLASGEPIGLADIGDTKVRDVSWIGEDRLLIIMSEAHSLPSIGMPKSEMTYGLIFEPAARKVTPLFHRNRAIMPMLFGAAEVRQTSRGAAIFVRGYRLIEDRRLNLYRIDPVTGLGRVSEEMDLDIEDYVLDAEGEVLAKAENDYRRRRWSLLVPLGQSFMTPVWSTENAVDGPALLGMGRSPRTILVDASRDDLVGASGDGDWLIELFEVDVDTGEWRGLVFAHPPTQLIHHPQTGLLIGAVQVGPSKRAYEFFDASMSQRWSAVERAFAGRNPELVSWSDDMEQVVVFTSGPADSGQYQLVDFARGDANIIGDVYPEVGPDQVGAVREVRYRAQDGLEIHGYLTLPPGRSEAMGLPLVVLTHGGPAAHDVAGFDWWAQALAARGYAVLQANFRGSTGYGPDFMQAGYGEWGRKMQTDLSDGVQSLVLEGRIDPARVCIVGGSYGGYAALAGVTLQHGIYRCAVSFAGVSDLRLMVQDEARQTGRESRIVRYWKRFLGVERLGDRQLELLSPAHQADAGDAPVLLMHGQDDTVVPILQSVRMAEALDRVGRPYEFVRLEGEDHWLSRADTRQRMLNETVRFLEAHNPP